MSPFPEQENQALRQEVRLLRDQLQDEATAKNQARRDAYALLQKLQGLRADILKMDELHRRAQAAESRTSKAERKVVRLEARASRVESGWHKLRIAQRDHAFEHARALNSSGRFRRENEVLRAENARLTEAGQALARQLAGVVDG